MACEDLEEIKRVCLSGRRSEASSEQLAGEGSSLLFVFCRYCSSAGILSSS